MAKPNILCDCAGLSNDRWLEYRAHGPKGDIPYTVGGKRMWQPSSGCLPGKRRWSCGSSRKGDESPTKGKRRPAGHGPPVGAHAPPTGSGKKTGSLVEDDTFLYQHADHPYALANIDRRYTRREDGGTGRPGVQKLHLPQGGGTGAEGAIPLHYELQLRFLPAVLDVEYEGVFVYLGE